jgi:ABC-type glycerol-3-phosphate transport system substrate-binding protein
VGFLGLLCIVLVIAACGGSAGTDPGTAKGTYTVVVTGTAGSGSTAYQSSVNVPITVQ